MSKTTDEQDRLVDQAWDLVKEALNSGKITLGLIRDPKSGMDVPNTRVLETEDVIDLAKFFVQLKIKKPQLITPPEDYNLKETSGGSDDEAD